MRNRARVLTVRCERGAGGSVLLRLGEVRRRARSPALDADEASILITSGNPGRGAAPTPVPTFLGGSREPKVGERKPSSRGVADRAPGALSWAPGTRPRGRGARKGAIGGAAGGGGGGRRGLGEEGGTLYPRARPRARRESRFADPSTTNTTHQPHLLSRPRARNPPSRAAARGPTSNQTLRLPLPRPPHARAGRAR